MNGQVPSRTKGFYDVILRFTQKHYVSVVRFHQHHSPLLQVQKNDKRHILSEIQILVFNEFEISKRCTRQNLFYSDNAQKKNPFFFTLFEAKESLSQPT